MEGLDYLSSEPAAPAPVTASAPTPAEPSRTPRVRRSTVLLGAVSAGGALVASRVPLVGSLVGIAAGTLSPSPIRAILGAVACAAFPLAAIPICGFELWMLGTHLRRDPSGTVATVLGYAPPSESEQP